MINLTPGVTSSIWVSLRESLSYGSSASIVMTLTNDITGATKSFTPTDLQPTNKWSRFEIGVGTPEDFSIGKLDLRPGMWSFTFTADSTTLETGKVVVSEQKTWTTLERPAKNVPTLKR